MSSEALTACATLLLACVTVTAIAAPVIQRNRERVRERQAALRVFRFMLVIYQRRLNELAHDLQWRADVLLTGLDTMMVTAFSSDVTKLIPQSNGDDGSVLGTREPARHIGLCNPAARGERPSSATRGEESGA
jgi:hypothetical protein